MTFEKIFLLILSVSLAGLLSSCSSNSSSAKFVGYKKTSSGIQYQIHKAGNGQKIGDRHNATVHYRGTLLNGTEFDSSFRRGRPATFDIYGVIKGWTEILKMMPEPSKWRVVIPPKHAYGNKQVGTIPPNSTLIFDIEVLKFH